MSINILFIGDVFSAVGRRFLTENLKRIKTEEKIDFCIANCENASHGIGLSLRSAEELFAAGIDFMTLGNHAWGKRDIFTMLDDQPIIRPGNMAKNLPGTGYKLVDCPFGKIGIVNVQGRIYMEPCDNPFEVAFESAMSLREHTGIIIVDIHAEATSEKIALGYYLDGLVSAVVGTHTHVQTADEKILSQGTAFISDVGMTGPSDSVIGMEKERVIEKFVNVVPCKFEPATGSAVFNAVVIEIEPDTGRAISIRRLNYTEPSRSE